MSSQRIYHQKLVSIVQLILWMNKTIYKIIYKTSLANNSFYRYEKNIKRQCGKCCFESTDSNE
jgi:hypothetical protein